MAVLTETKSEAKEMMQTYLTDEEEAPDDFAAVRQSSLELAASEARG